MKTLKTVEALTTRLLEIQRINSAAAVLSWDQETYMPAGGGVIQKNNAEYIVRGVGWMIAMMSFMGNLDSPARLEARSRSAAVSSRLMCCSFPTIRTPAGPLTAAPFPGWKHR